MTEKCRSRGYQGLAPLTKEVRTLIKPVLGARGFAGVDIIENWEALLGEDLAAGVVPEKLAFPAGGRTKGTLYVKTGSGAFAQMFEYQKERVLERLNTYFGYPAMAQIKIRQGALPVVQKPAIKAQKPVSAAAEKALAAKVVAIDDPDLRQQTYDIGLALLRK